MAVAALLIFALLAPEPDAKPSAKAHELEVRELADVSALSQAILNHCFGYSINASKLLMMKEQLHFDRMLDGGLLAQEGQAALLGFENEFQEASSSEAWCKANYKLFGPGGSSIPNIIMNRKN